MQVQLVMHILKRICWFNTVLTHQGLSLDVLPSSFLTPLSHRLFRGFPLFLTPSSSAPLSCHFILTPLSVPLFFAPHSQPLFLTSSSLSSSSFYRFRLVGSAYNCVKTVPDLKCLRKKIDEFNTAQQPHDIYKRSLSSRSLCIYQSMWWIRNLTRKRTSIIDFTYNIV